MNQRELLYRKKSNDIIKSLDAFVYAKTSKIGPAYEWKLFYLFIVKSYKVERSERYSISELALILKSNDIKPSTYINAYAHSLYSLALYEDKDIYNNGFNI